MRYPALVAVMLAGIVVCGPLTVVSGNEPPNPNAPTSHVVQPAPSPAVSIQKPDLIVEKIQLTTQPNPGGGTLVMVSYTIYNKGPVASRLRPTAAGRKAWHDNPSTNWLFTCWFDMREYPNGAFPPLGGGLATELGAFQRQTISDGRVVPAGRRVQFRATVDSLNWIDESNETNNSKTVIWPPLPINPPIKK